VTASPDVIAQAIAQIEQGFAAFALRANAKVPITEHGFKNATTKPEWIETQLQAPPAGNYGIVWPTGVPPVVVFDLDDGGGADRPWQDRLLALIATNGRLPATKSTTTPSGGRHAFFRWPTETPIPPGDELFGFTVRWPGRGYLVGPGSSIDGKAYTAGPEPTIADLPQPWVEAALRELPQKRYGVGEDGEFAIPASGYVLPESIASGRRYSAVRDFVASRYNAALPREELWQLVRTVVAPRFQIAKTEDELRGDFERAMAKITERLGPPARLARMAPEDAVAAVRPIEVLNLAEIAVEAVTWLWHRFLPVGSITLFDGNPGEGKSTIIADVIARLTTGGDWPDGTPVGPAGRALYITKEDDAATQVRPRIEVAGGDVRLVDFVAADLLFPRDAGRFRELLESTRPRLVLLDPLMSYLEGKVKVISDNEIRSAIMTPLAEIGRDLACTVLVIRHFNKGSGQSALLRGAGSLGGLAGAARMVLALTGDPSDDDDRARVFGVVKSNFEAKPPSLKALIESAPVEGFQMTVSRVTWHGNSTTSVADLMERTREEHQLVEDAKDSLAELLEPAGSRVPATEIHSKMKGKGHSRNATYNALGALHGKIVREGFPSRSFWTIPTAVDFDDTHPSGTEGGTTGMSGTNPSRTTLYETPTTGMTGMSGPESHTSHTSLSSSGAGAPRARARETDRPSLVVVRDTVDRPTTWCHYWREHALRHRDVQGEHPWCEICSPQGHSA
jgi:hypothetical protein